MDSESKHDASSEIASKPRTELVGRRKMGDHMSKYSGSRKSSVDTTNTGNVKNMPKIENTYKLSPDENKRFYAYKIYPNILELVQEKLLQSEKISPSGYNPKACATLTRELADSIRREAKNLSVPRYKIVVHIVVGENAGQDTRVASRCLWNTEFDNCVSISFKAKYTWASAVIYVLYTE
jgi:tctex1 domain-containing protein 2